MKNNYLKRMLGLTLASVLSISNISISGAEDLLTSGMEELTLTPTPTPSPDPTKVPEQEATPELTVTPTPELSIEPTSFPEDSQEQETDPTETPEEPAEPSVSPTEIPADPTEIPADPTEIPADPTEIPANPTEYPVTPTVTPMDPTVTPSEPELTPTEIPVSPTVSPTETPIPSVTPESMTIEELIRRIDELGALEEITLEQRDEIQKIREFYDSLSEDEKEQVLNYELFEEIELKLNALLDSEDDLLTDGENADSLSDSAAQIGAAVYYTNYVSNLHAGKEFYLNSLKQNYALTFSQDFAEVMEEIEAEYKEKYKLQDVADQNSSATTSSADVLLVRNWQDILAIYVYQQSAKGDTSFTLNRDSKTALAKIFAEMNPVERDQADITRVTYGEKHINYYIKKNNIAKADREILKKYTETDCMLLCAVVTAAKGFVRQSVGDSVSEERVNVIAAAYSLIGEVGYFYGGKSNIIGMDSNWGTAEKVTAEGSTSTGTLRAYGLDCSGFVTWSVINGYQDTGMQDAVGDGTSEQWEKANVVTEQSAQPGDLVFLAGPEKTGPDNHVGILCGKTAAGDWIAVHCSSSKNGVTVGEAYSASFRYIRQPSFYPTTEEVQQMEASGSVTAGLLTELSVEDITIDEFTSLTDDSVAEPFEITSEPVEEVAGPMLPDDSYEDWSANSSESTINWEENGSPLESAEEIFVGPELIITDPVVSVPAGTLIDNSVVEPF